jgi:hypothetical protein
VLLPCSNKNAKDVNKTGNTDEKWVTSFFHMLARSFGKESAYHAYIINNKLKTLKRYDTAKNYIILHKSFSAVVTT